MHEYDTVLKLLLRGSAQLPLQRLAGLVVEKWIDIELPEVRALRMDLLGEAAHDVLVHLELQSTNDPDMALRMAEYCLATYRLYRRFSRQLVLYVGDAPMRMKAELKGPNQWFRCEMVDIRDLDGEELIESASIGDNVIAILARLPDRRDAVRRILHKIAGLETGERVAAIKQLALLAGLRNMGELISEEASKMPITADIMDHDLFGPLIRKGQIEGELTILRRLIERRFGSIPDWAEERLLTQSTAELEELSVRLLDAPSLEQLLG